jgi:fructosamine-3-kinase
MAGDEPIDPPIDLSPSEAERILSDWLGREVRCIGLRRLTGGCVRTVLEATFDGAESPVVLKLARELGDEGIPHEGRVLGYLRTHTTFPVPEPFHADISGAVVPYSYLIMERVPGTHLGDARAGLDPRQRVGIERQMGEAVAALHTHTRSAFGSAVGEVEYASWPEHVRESMLDLHRENEIVGLLSPEVMAGIRPIADAVPSLLEAPGPPTLTHGDIWATNIMVDGGRLTGFLDPGGLFAHREYELAYLEIWRTAGEPFFEVYHEVHPRLEGYERRRMVYWLNTLLIHVWYFKESHYVRATEELVSAFRI